MFNKKRNSAYIEGYHAAAVDSVGLKSRPCPYPGTPAHILWLDGYHDKQQEIKQGKKASKQWWKARKHFK